MGSSATKELVNENEGIVVKKEEFIEYYKAILKILDSYHRIEDNFFDNYEMGNLYLLNYKE